MKKKTWFMAVCAAALLMLALLVLLIGKRQGRPQTVDPESRYSYTIRQTKHGLLVTIYGGEEGYRWNAVSENPYAVYPVEKTDTVQKREFLLSPVADGTSNITITLMNMEIPYDAAYQLSLMVRTAENAAQLLNAGHRAYPGAVRDPEGRYAISPMEDGSHLVCMGKSTESEWVASLVSGSAAVKWYQPSWMSVSPEQPEEAETEENPAQETWFRISDSGADDATVHLCDRKQGNVLVLEFARDAEGVFSLVTHAMQKKTEITGEAAAWNLPVGAALLEYGTAALYSQEDGQAFQADTAVMLLEGVSWELMRAEGETRKDLALRDYRMSDEAAGAEADALWVYRADDAWCCAWETDHTAYLLKGRDTNRNTLIAVADILKEQMT